MSSPLAVYTDLVGWSKFWICISWPSRFCHGDVTITLCPKNNPRHFQL